MCGEGGDRHGLRVCRSIYFYLQIVDLSQLTQRNLLNKISSLASRWAPSKGHLGPGLVAAISRLCLLCSASADGKVSPQRQLAVGIPFWGADDCLGPALFLSLWGGEAAKMVGCDKRDSQPIGTGDLA